MTEFEKEIALIEKMGLKTSPLRWNMRIRCTNCGVCLRSLRQKDTLKIRLREKCTKNEEAWTTV